MTAYYNEIDPYAAQWLRNLIEMDLIAPFLNAELATTFITEAMHCINDLSGKAQS